LIRRAAPDIPYGHTAGLRRVDGHAVDLNDEEIATRNALEEYERHSAD
jgi:ParB family chromosome partitioning protein